MSDDEATRPLLALANRFHAALTAIGRVDLAGHIQRAGAAWGDRDLVVVACGDTKVGKSSLINAILERPDLLPVDDDVATSAQIFVSHGTTSQATVTRWNYAGNIEALDIALSEVEDYGSLMGDPVARSGVTRVQIRTAHPLLAAGLTFVDTPGLGSLTVGHRELAAAMIESADVILLTIAADEPVRRSELDFLATELTRLGVIAVVLTRVDRVADIEASMTDLHHRLSSFAEADDSAGRVAKRLAEAPVFPVSSRLALRATPAKAERQAVADDLRRRSGIAGLTAFLEKEAARPANVRLVRLRRVLAYVGEAAASDLASRMHGSDDDQRRRDLRAIQNDLDALGKLAQRCKALVAAEIPRAQTAANRAIGAELSAAEVALRNQFTTESRSVEMLADLPARVESTVQAAWLRGTAAMVDALTTFSEQLADELGAEMPDSLVNAIVQDEIETERMVLATDTRARFDIVDHGFPAAVSTTFIANLIAPLLGPIGLVVGAATGCALVVTRLVRQGQRQTVQANSQILNAALRDTRQDLGAEAGLRVLAARQRLEAWIDEVITERRIALQVSREQIDETARLTASERTAQRNAFGRQLSKVRQLQDEFARVTAQLAPAPGSPDSPEPAGTFPHRPISEQSNPNQGGTQ